MKSLSYLNKYLIKYKWRLLLGIFFIIGSNWFKVKMPEFFGEITDSLQRNIETDNPDKVIVFALETGGYFILLSLAAGFFLFLTRQTIIVISRFIEYDLKNEIYSQYQKLSYSFFKKNNTGDLMNRISEDVTKVRMYLGPGLMYTINLTVLSTLSIYNMIHISGYLTIFVLIPLPIMSYVIFKVSSRINRISTSVQEEQSYMSTLIQETFSGIRIVKAYSRNKEVEEKFNNSAKNYKTKNMRLVMVNALFMPTIFILIGISTVLCIYLGGLLYHEEELSMGGIIKFIFYVNMLTWPFASVGWVISIIQRASASQTRINEFLEIKPEIENPNTVPFDFKGKIEFINVSYTYPSGITGAKNLNFTINKGETLGIIGRTGSGKSTIVDLLMRQFDVDEGEILIDGKNIKNINLESYRDQLGIVPQDVFLFSESIRDNILFGTKNNDENDERLIEVSKNAHVYHNIVEFKDKFDTILGERGVNLSGGQKQRVSIARALIRNPKLLILDDCLSAVDTETEEIILNNLNKLQTLTSIVVSHRVSSIRNSTTIINIDKGELIEMGTHTELINRKGEYAELYHKQLDEENLDK